MDCHGMTPTAEVFAVQLHGEAPHRVSVRCPHCHQIHSHRWFDNDGPVFRRTAPCTGDNPVLQYTIDLRSSPLPPSMRRYVSGPHTVAGEDRDDNAFNVPAPNWEE
jgi:hypothetical protein